MTTITSAIYNKSASNNVQCPVADRQEFALIGRSNVGKSTLINIMCKKKELAKTSPKPGKTQLINYFDIVSEGEDKEKKSRYLVDLPGYGYARVSKDTRGQREGMIVNYLLEKENLTHIFVLIDSRLTPQAIDVDFVNRMYTEQRSFSLVFTKSDKSSQKEVASNIKAFMNELGKMTKILPAYYITSSEKRQTVDILVTAIHEMVEQGKSSEVAE